MLNWIISDTYQYLEPFNYVKKKKKKKRAQARLKTLSAKGVYKSLKYKEDKEDLALNNPKWLICHKTKPKIRLHKYLPSAEAKYGIIFIYVFFLDSQVQLKKKNPSFHD